MVKILALGDFHSKFPVKLKKKLEKEEFDLIVGVGDYAGISEWRPWVMHVFRAAKSGRRRKSPEEFYGKKRFKKLLDKDFSVGKEVLSAMDKFGKKGVFIFGNSDDEWYRYPFSKVVNSVKNRNLNFVKKLKNLKVITYKKAKLKGNDFVGFGGYMDIESYFDVDEFKDQDEEDIKHRRKRHNRVKKKFFSILKKTKSPRIFVLHYPPFGFFDIIKDKKDNPMNGKSSGVKFFTQAIRKYKPRLVLCGHMHEYQGKKKLGSSLIVNPGDAGSGKAAIIDFPEKGKIKVKFIKGF